MVAYIKHTGKDISSLILRLGFGFFIAFGHGLSKFLMLIGEDDIMFVTLFGLSQTTNLIIAMCIEFFCGLALMIGFKTRIAAFFLMLLMLIAIFGVHIKDNLFVAYADNGNSMESAFVYFIGFTGIYFLKAGKFSLDNLIEKKINR